DIVEAAGSLLAALNADPELIAPALWSGGQIRGIEDVTLGSMIWTAAVQLKGEGSWEVRPIPYEEWPKIFEIADPDSMERLILERVRRSAPESGRPSTLEAYLAPLFKAYREETAPFYERGTPPEAEMMRFFLFSER